MFPAKRLLHPTLQRFATDAAVTDEAIELLELALRLLQRRGDASLLPFEQLLALDNDERAIEFADLRAQARGAHVGQLARERLLDLTVATGRSGPARITPFLSGSSRRAAGTM
jgi:hypothetical protein